MKAIYVSTFTLIKNNQTDSTVSLNGYGCFRTGFGRTVNECLSETVVC